MTLADQVAEIVKEDTTTEGFVINTMEDAVEADKRIAYNQEQQANIDQLADTQIDALKAKITKLEGWRTEAKKEFVESEQFYTHRLEFFLRDQIANGAKKKSINLPNTKIKMIKQQPEYIKDERMMFDYAKANGFVKVKESADWSAIKKAGKVVGTVLIDENGEQIPGVEVHEREDKFSIEVNA
ncbi:hypothetical protein JCM19046_3547 [Bacillus sp. JCM 19046]|nr:hypothetical protein JCM19045_4228 [Bacillus sp. JCM 19045]GAF18934.1 hypothetical protein JCM19046_3547 [Bacillus sp. JCM 19046]